MYKFKMMSNTLKAEEFFKETLSCFKLDSFKAIASMDMLLIVQEQWFNYLLETKEFGILKDIEGLDFFVCTTSKSGIAFRGDLKQEEKEQIEKLNTLYHYFYELDMNDQGDVLKKFFPEE